MNIDDNEFDPFAASSAEDFADTDLPADKSAEDMLKEMLGTPPETEKTVVDTGSAQQQTANDAAEAGAETAPEAAVQTGSSDWKRRLFPFRSGTYGSTETYAQPASYSRTPGTVLRNSLLTVLCLVIGIVAALQYKAIASRKTADPDSEERINELLSTINNLHSELNSLEAEKDELQNRLELLEESSQDEQIAALRDELDSIRTFAGLTEVKGAGIHILLDFSERTNVNNIQTRLLLLINELRASGAQAISINGIRILAMTEIRVVSDQYISVNARQLAPPFDINAIGDAADLYSGVTMGGSGIVYQIRNLAGTTCTWDIQDDMTISGAEESDIKTDLLKPGQ